MNSDSQRLGTLIAEQLRCAEAMLETLTRESQALAGGDVNALGAATQAKGELVDALEKLESERSALAERDDTAETAETAEWQRLREVIGLCKEQNQRNGLLLKARAENVRSALKTLRGSDPEVYSATGRTPSRPDARTLGTA